MTDSGQYTPETLARKAKMAELLLGQSMKPEKIEHWAQGLAQLGRAGIGGYMAGEAEREQKEGDAKGREFIAQLLGGGAAAAPVAPQSAVPETAPAQTAEPMGSLPGMPRGYRNNNPLNIEAGGFTEGQPGFSGSDGRFAKFASMDQGVGAANKLLDVYQNKHGLNTVAGILNRWAPANDGNDVNAYAANVAKQLGVDPNAPITPEMRPQLIAAMAQHENGRPLPQGAMPPQQMAQAAPTANPMQAKIIDALRSKDPFISKAAQGMAGSILTKQFEAEKPTNDMKELSAINAERKSRGEPPMGLFEYQTKLKEAGKPVTNINQQQESEYQKTTGKQLAEQNMEIAKAAGSARGKIATLTRLDTMLKDPAMYTGKGGEGILELKRLGKAIGIDVGDVGPAEAVKSISNQFALELRNPSGGAGMPGAMSDKDREFLQSMVPGLGQNPQGNALIIDYMKRVAQRSVDVDKLRQQYVRKNGRLDEGFYNELSDWSEAHPVFSDDDMKKAAPPAAPAGGTSIDDLLRKYGGSK